MKENKKEFCNQLCKLLQMTSCAGSVENNPLKELRFIETEWGEVVRPIFADGNGEDGYYDVNVSGDSNMGILYDVFNRFIKKVW